MKAKWKENIKYGVSKVASIASAAHTWVGMYQPEKPDILKRKNEQTHR